MKSNHQSNFLLAAALMLTFSIVVIKGGALQWVSMVWVSLSSLTLLVTLFRYDVLKGTVNWNRVLRSSDAALALLVFIAFQVWTTFQTVVFSTNKYASVEHAMLGVGMLCLLIIWLFTCRHRQALTALYVGMILMCLLQAVYGMWVYLSSVEQILWMPKLYYLDRPTGFFVNANHFAAYLVLSVILLVSRCVAAQRTVSSNTLLVRVLDQIYQPRYLIIIFFLLVLVASKSIGAITSLLVVAGFALFRVFLYSAHKVRWLTGALVAFVLTLLMLSALEYSAVESQLREFEHTLYRRLALSRAAFSMLQEHWLFGVGGGAFYSQFAMYRTLDIGNTYYNHAHNDLLQFWIEYGLIGASLLVVFLILVFKDNLAVLTSSRSTMRLTFAYASIFMIMAMLVHSLVDFPLRIPGYSVCFLVLISINSLYNLASVLFTQSSVGNVHGSLNQSSQAGLSSGRS